MTKRRYLWSRGKQFIRVRLDDTRGAWHVQVETSGLAGAPTEIKKPGDAEAEIAESLARSY